MLFSGASEQRNFFTLRPGVVPRTQGIRRETACVPGRSNTLCQSRLQGQAPVQPSAQLPNQLANQEKERQRERKQEGPGWSQHEVDLRELGLTILDA